MKKKINYLAIFKQKIAIFMLSIFIIIFSYTSYYNDSGLNVIKHVGGYIDDSLLYKRIYPDNNHNNEVVIVKIDEKTLNNLQKSDIKVLSFSKSKYAQVIEKLIEDYGVASIGVDVIFANTSYYGSDDEKKLQEVLEKYNSQVVIATRGDNKEKPLCLYNSAQHGAIEISAESRVRKFSILHREYNRYNNCENSENEDEQEILQAFGIQVYQSYLDNLKNKIKRKKALKQLQINLEDQYTKNNGYFYFNYSTNLEENEQTFGFRSYSLIDILEGKEIDLEGKIVLIGEVGTVLHDTHFTPINFQYQMPGVELHANIITSMLYSSYLENLEDDILILIACFSILGVMITVINTRTFTNILAIIFFLLIHLIVGLQLFVNGIIYPVFFMMYVIILSFIVSYIYKLTITDKNRRFLKKAFSMYVSADMVDMIYKDPAKLSLKGENSQASIFFSDIANFTQLSETMKTEDLFHFLNNYFSEMTKILLMHQGTLDKYIGDAIMGFYNAPLSVDNHEYLACKTALSQIKKLTEINQQNKEKGFPQIQIRIGINTGEVMHGNLGATGKKINYTVIGDAVNLASRLEGINKEYGSTILISQHTYDKVKDDFTFRELDTIKVKGKSKAVKIYELLGEKTQEKNHEILKENYSQALSKYYAGEYNQAEMLFAKNKKDTASINMKKRCQALQAGEIQVEKGVYSFITK